MKTRASQSKDPLVALTALPPKADVHKGKEKSSFVLENSETSEDARPAPSRRSKPAPRSPSKLSKKTGRMMNVATGEKMQAEGSQPPAVAAEPAEAQADDQTAQADDQEAPQPALAPAAKESKRPRGRPPGPRKAVPQPAEQPAQPRLELAETSLRNWTREQHESRKRAEDAAVREAQRSGRFVDLAVHSFVAAMPPSRLVVPEGVSVDFVRRQIQYRVEEHGGELTADAIELQLKDNHGQIVPAVSFNSRGREMTVSDYGLIPGPPGVQHHIWAIFVDDTAARIQREASARILQPTGASNLHRPVPPPSVVAYEGALSPARRAPEAGAAAQHREQMQEDAALRQEQQMQEAEASLSPSKKQRTRPNIRWSEEETALLVDNVIVRGTGSWADILAQHRGSFDRSRSSVDLKDKWRNLVKAAQKPAQAEVRTQFLTREQIVKILEFLHKDDE